MTLDAGWVAALHARCDVAPMQPRDHLHVADSASPIGSIESSLGERLIGSGLPLVRRDTAWVVEAAVGVALDAALERIARWLAAQGLVSHWRDELLDVVDAQGRVLGRIERSAVRRLGIATQAVHLVGLAASGGVWVQQRSLDKAVDPGLWDTLMGGLVAAGEDTETTLARETWEEAGLRVDALDAMAPQGRFTVQRPVPDGHMIEHIHVFEASVPASLLPVNQDGEVLRFECLTLAALEERLRAGAFTLEAARILADALLRWQAGDQR